MFGVTFVYFMVHIVAVAALLSNIRFASSSSSLHSPIIIHILSSLLSVDLAINNVNNILGVKNDNFACKLLLFLTNQRENSIYTR